MLYRLLKQLLSSCKWGLALCSFGMWNVGRLVAMIEGICCYMWLTSCIFHHNVEPRCLVVMGDG